MALTEPQAGSSLADITTAAEPTAQGDYRIKGQNIFISASEHDGVDNVVNLMLAKIKGAPAGSRAFRCSSFRTSRMVERDKLLDTALELAGTMSGKDPAGLRLTKEAININMDIGGLEHALGVENRNQALLYGEFFKGTP